MSQGYLLFAHNNEEIDYGLLAAWCARRIHRWLEKPVSLVADKETVSRLGVWTKLFDHIIPSENVPSQSRRYLDRMLSFNNYDRSHAWQLTPYNETIVLDTDIVIQSSTMNRAWNNQESVLICQQSPDAFNIKTTHPEFRSLGDTGIDFVWATQFYFRKDEESKLFFDTCQWARGQFPWLSRIYNVDNRLLRNDYVWSIAAHMLGDCESLPWNLLHATDKIHLYSMTEDSIILYNKDFGARHIGSHDVHVMNKFDLLPMAARELEVSND